jgi:transcriptional accessory protein Tex/SPT6
MGRVVNITKFGAFVNILPGRDGLVHISKLGGGKRINSVEDVLELGQEIEVRVEEIDDKGKVSLTPAGDPPPAKEGASSGESSGGSDRGERRERAPRVSAPSGSTLRVELRWRRRRRRGELRRQLRRPARRRTRRSRPEVGPSVG